ncbi:tyrosine-type recombinase/integrase [Buttiauxella sp. A111]|uniref:tyrosine-type recombinase/integrase n=1 Tax=Buttiauxella sp. A111 TaxID=2563088 RepID=UPI0010E4ADB7|nr:tyrosine-type recombinase/integrase [Buttiauxella sp. A111]GDX06353.1 site-specific integrase [Buttiauxella sp. A111]
MAFYTVEKRTTSLGVARYRVTVGIKEGGVYVHRESKTFPRQAQAKAWGAHRVAELESGVTVKKKGMTLGELIDRYLADPNMKKGADKIGRLGMVKRYSIVDFPLVELTMSRWVEFARTRRAKVSGSTVATELSYVKTALDVALPFYGEKALVDEYRAAWIYLQRLNVLTKSNTRNRRISREEYVRLHEVLALHARRSRLGNRYDDLFEFSIWSCMRLGEVCRIRWDDLNTETRSILVRDRKDPRKKQGNHMVVPLLGEAWNIVQRQPRTPEFIFPVNPKTMSQLFQDIKHKLNIPDIRLHDARREGASRLFEYGFTVEEVAQVTGHKSLKTLWTVYREMYPETLHERFDELTAKKTPL